MSVIMRIIRCQLLLRIIRNFCLLRKSLHLTGCKNKWIFAYLVKKYRGTILYDVMKRFTRLKKVTSEKVQNTFRAALAFFYCAYYPRIFSSMFCGEITTNRRQLYRFRVFKIAELEIVRPDVSGVNLRNMAAKRTILGPILLVISYLIITLALLK